MPTAYSFPSLWIGKEPQHNCMDTLPETVPLYGPEGVLFVKTENPHSAGMLMRIYADTCDNLDRDKLKEKQERIRTTSSGSTSSQGNP